MTKGGSILQANLIRPKIASDRSTIEHAQRNDNLTQKRSLAKQLVWMKCQRSAKGVAYLPSREVLVSKHALVFVITYKLRQPAYEKYHA